MEIMQQMHLDSWYWVHFVLPICRFSEFGSDGGPAATSLKPKFHVFSNHLSTLTGAKVPEFDVSIWFSQCQPRIFYDTLYWQCYLQIEYLVAGAIALKALGSLLFIFGSSFGAYLLVRKLNLLAYLTHFPFISLINSWTRVCSTVEQILHQTIVTPILYDFYNYDVEKKEFAQLFPKFTLVSH